MVWGALIPMESWQTWALSPPFQYMARSAMMGFEPCTWVEKEGSAPGIVVVSFTLMVLRELAGIWKEGPVTGPEAAW